MQSPHSLLPPPADATGKTQVPPVPAARRQQLDTIAANSKWEALLEETESALGQFRFSLDLHRLSAQALHGLGHADAAAALIAEIAGLVRRMPSWPDLLAADGSPLADATTRDWIAEHSGGASSGGGGRVAGADDGEDPDAITKAKQLLSTGKASDAIKVAQESIDAATRPRHRFTRRLALAELCLTGGLAKLARGIFGSLQAELDALGISEWEPVLAARCLEGVVKSVRASAPKGAPPDPAGDLAFERLCRLDPAAAARLATL